MVNTRMLTGVVAALALTAGSSVATTPAAQALGTPPPSDGGPVTDPGQGWNPNQDVKRKTYHDGGRSCHVVSSANYLGATCVDASKSGRQRTVKEILGKDPLPDCWQVPLNDRELEGLNLGNGAKHIWVWNKCLEGIDKKTLEVDEDQVRVWYGLVPWQRGKERVDLTDNQVELLHRYENNGFVPAPVMGVTPSALPLVNEDVSFFNFGEDTVQVDVPEVGMRMRAHIQDLTVLPEGRPGPVIRCDGTGYEAEPGEERSDHPRGCWHRYEQSSLGMDEDAYRAEIHATWVVEVSMNDGPWRPFNEFTKGSYYNVGVNEVQALVVN